jgi:pimeloyl-ACP methyl ester carboxylesterase
VFDWLTDYSADMTVATRDLLADGARRVVVGGFSRGALVGLGTAPKLGSSIVGVISVSGGPSPSEGYPTIASLSRFAGPILLICSKDDPVFPTGTSARIAQAHRAGPDKLVVLQGSEHALALLDGPHASRVRNAILAFLAQVLRP